MQRPARSPSPLRLWPALLIIALILACAMTWYHSELKTNRASVMPSAGVAPHEMAPSVSRVTLTRPNRPLTQVERLAQKQDVTIDDWDTEVLSEAADKQLAELRQLLESPERIELGAVQAIVTSDVVCSLLKPAKLSQVFRSGPLTVWRASSMTEIHATDVAGIPRLVSALHELARALGPAEKRRAKFKLYQIEKRPEWFVTRLYYEASHHGLEQSRQQSAIWLCDWTYPTSDGRQAPRLMRVTLEQYEEVHLALRGGQLLVDCTQSVLGDNAAYAEQILPGINHWATRIPREFMGQLGHHGLAVGDVNGDELDDLYVCDAGGLPNRLYVQQPDGTAVDISEQSGVNLLEDSTGGLLIDIDNDGDQDLVVATDQLLQLAENDGSGRFTLRGVVPADTDPYSLCAADYDADGDLDIYVCGYDARKRGPMHRGLPFPLPYHDANNGGKNVLLQNQGDFRFIDVTQQTGLDVNNRRFSFAAAWEDFDNDGDPDLYVANDFGRNNLYRNDGGYFTDIAAAAGVEDQAAGMSVTWGDYNRDGLMDLYVSNMFSAAGNRVAYQRQFAAGQADQTVLHLRRMARGNSLFLNATGGETAAFRDVSEPAAATMGRWAWASKFLDMNNDGWQDLIVANGFVTGENSTDL